MNSIISILAYRFVYVLQMLEPSELIILLLLPPVCFNLEFNQQLGKCKLPNTESGPDGTMSWNASLQLLHKTIVVHGDVRLMTSNK
jgi:hypothetical protein